MYYIQLELINNIRHKIVTASGNAGACSAGVLSAFGQEANIFRICCSAAGFVDFLKVIITVILYVADPSGRAI